MVFISYSRLDFLLRDEIVNVLKNEYKIWFDEKDIKIGDLWWDEICSNIENQEIFILLVTEQYLNSEFCKVEYEYALNLGYKILPILFDKSLEKMLPQKLKEIQNFVYKSYEDSNKDEFLKRLHTIEKNNYEFRNKIERPSLPYTKEEQFLNKINSNNILSYNEQVVLFLEIIVEKIFSRRSLLIELVKRKDITLKVQSDIIDYLKNYNKNLEEELKSIFNKFEFNKENFKKIKKEKYSELVKQNLLILKTAALEWSVENYIFTENELKQESFIKNDTDFMEYIGSTSVAVGGVLTSAVAYSWATAPTILGIWGGGIGAIGVIGAAAIAAPVAVSAGIIYGIKTWNINKEIDRHIVNFNSEKEKILDFYVKKIRTL